MLAPAAPCLRSAGRQPAPQGKRPVAASVCLPCICVPMCFSYNRLKEVYVTKICSPPLLPKVTTDQQLGVYPQIFPCYPFLTEHSNVHYCFQRKNGIVTINTVLYIFFVVLSSPRANYNYLQTLPCDVVCLPYE